MTGRPITPESAAEELKRLADYLRAAGRNDLLLRSLGASVIEDLRLEVAKGKLSRLRITSDYRLYLTDYGNKEIILNPVHKAVYLLFLAHPEGIEFKRLSDHRKELLGYYMSTSKMMDKEKIIEGVDHLTDSQNNGINEKCSRIKSLFLSMMDEYTASYYFISSHTQRHIGCSSRVWFERLKVITLPRELVVWEGVFEHLSV